MTTELQPPITVEHACELVERVLEGNTRRRILERAMGKGGFVRGARRLRLAMRAHAFETPSGSVTLEPVVLELDRRVRAEGFHVLQAWDYGRQQFSEDNVGVLMLDHCQSSGFLQRQEPVALAILLDYYLLHVLALCVMCAWHGDDPDRVFVRVTELIERLQGPGGSGQRFVDDAETLLMLAVSHFHPEESVYDRLIAQVRTLGPEHRRRFALVSAAVLGGHLRWGSTVMYRRDLVRMRKDNEGDYPWLLFSLSTLLRVYAAHHASARPRERDGANDASGSERSTGGRGGPHDSVHDGVGAGEKEGAGMMRNLVASILGGLGADPWAFLEDPPAALTAHADEHAELRALLERHADDLLVDAEPLRPAGEGFSPLAFHFNFPNNALVAMVIVAILQGAPQALPLNALLLSDDPRTREMPADLRGVLAKTLMYYSASSPDRLGQSGEMLIVYDPQIALRHFNQALSALGKCAGRR